MASNINFRNFCSMQHANMCANTACIFVHILSPNRGQRFKSISVCATLTRWIKTLWGNLHMLERFLQFWQTKTSHGGLWPYAITLFWGGICELSSLWEVKKRLSKQVFSLIHKLHPTALKNTRVAFKRLAYNRNLLQEFLSYAVPHLCRP